MTSHMPGLTRQRNTLETGVDVATITMRADCDKYTLVTKLGHGAFGDVSEYRAGAATRPPQGLTLHTLGGSHRVAKRTSVSPWYRCKSSHRSPAVKVLNNKQGGAWLLVWRIMLDTS